MVSISRILLATCLVSLGGLADAEPVTPENFLPQITAQLASEIRPEGELRLELVRGWTAPSEPSVPWIMEIVSTPRSLSSNMILRCRLIADGKRMGEWNLAVNAQLIGDAWVARQPVNRGDVLEPSQFEVRRVDRLRERDPVPTDFDISDLVASRPLSAGSVVTWRDTIRRPRVRKGDQVEVTAEEGSLSISMKAVAMQDGAMGDVVIVRNSHSRRDFSATVINDRHVQVRF